MTNKTQLGLITGLMIIPLCGGCLVPQPLGKGKELYLTEPKTKTPYYLYLPEDYVKTNGKRSDGKKWPLVMTFHGMKPFDTYDRQIHEWEQESDRYGFIACAPFMLHASVVREYPLNRETKPFKEDVDNILAVMEDVFRRTEADPTRVLATGWSEGGYMAHYIVNHYPHMFSCLAVKQCNFSSEMMDPGRAARYRDMPVAIFYTEHDFGICQKESTEAVAWYERRGFRSLASGVIDSYGHERMPEVAADFFAKHCGAVPKTPPKQLVRVRMSEISPAALAKADAGPPVTQPPRIQPLPTINYTESRRSAQVRTPAPVFDNPRTKPRSVPPPPTKTTQPQYARTKETKPNVAPPPSDRRLADASTPSRAHSSIGKANPGTGGPPSTKASNSPPLAATDGGSQAERLASAPQHELPTIRVPPRPESDLTRRRSRAPAPRYSVTRGEANIGMRLSTTIGLSPLLVSFEVRMPSSQLRNADVLWTDNGEPIASGATGQHILTEVGQHRIGVLVITADGLELRDSQTVTVHPRQTQVSKAW